MVSRKYIEQLRKRRRRRQRTVRAIVNFFVWTGVAVLYYIGFSLFFDTPTEYRLKHSTDAMRAQYALLADRYDTLDMVLHNLSARDKSVFQNLFDSDPYDFDSDLERKQAEAYENIFKLPTNRLKGELHDQIDAMEQQLDALNDTYHVLQQQIDAVGDRRNGIPAIQPVINKQLTLLTASYGMRIQPFYKTLQPHQGVDYAVPEGSSVFATADGVVQDVSLRNSTAGQSVLIDHGNGYQTLYSHLSKINVRKGQQVHRGDIIALTGNSGLSFAPHLHYEVSYNGMRVNPIHYFFMELSPADYRRLMYIAQSGMQSFD